MALDSNSLTPTYRNDSGTGQGMLDGELATALVRVFKLLSDETRLRILHSLVQNRELNVRTLCDLLEQSQPAVSHHLAVLRRASLIDCRRDGKHNFYFVLPERRERLADLVGSILPLAKPVVPRPTTPVSIPTTK